MPCSTCRDAGFIPSTPTANIAGLRKALDAGVASLCGCPQGQWYLSSIYAEYGSMLDRNKVEMGNPNFRQERGVPPGMLHGAEAVDWLEKDFVRVARATTPPSAPQADRYAVTDTPATLNSSLGASASLALAGLIGAVPASLQSATWHGPHFSPGHPLAALALSVAVLLGGAVAAALAARAWDALNRTIEQMSAVDDPAARKAD